MGVFKEFKEFAMKGNLVDMAVAFVMGAAFGKIVSAFINGLVMPVIGVLTTGIDFKDMKIVLAEAQLDAAGKVIKPEAALMYGDFITVFIDFLIVAFVMFLVVKAMNKAKKKQEQEPTAPPAPTKDQELLSEIRDLLKK
jgi:large conductance mechanosensitive channel